VDTAILGCTHYPLVAPIIQRAMGRGVTIVTSGQGIADAVEESLRTAGIENDPDRRGDYSFMCSGDPEAFRAVGTRFLQLPLGDVRQVDVAVPA
jgi:glutamate racemase